PRRCGRTATSRFGASSGGRAASTARRCDRATASGSRRSTGSCWASGRRRIGAMTVVLGLVAVLVFLLLLFLISAIKVAREYERGVIFRLGRLLDPPKGPGLFILIPIVDRMVKVDLRTITLNIPPQEVITKDNVPARVNAVAYFRIVDPKAAIVIEDHPIALQLRYLQTLLELGSSQATTIVFPAPIDLFKPFLDRADRSSN